MIRIELTTAINTRAKVCFDVSRNVGLHQDSMGHTSECAVAGKTEGLLELGEEVTWRAQALEVLVEFDLADNRI